MRTLILGLFIVCACSSDRAAITSAWKGKRLQELEQHPLFSKIPFTQKKLSATIEERNYQERGKFRTKASCQGLGGCLGLSGGSCQNVFIIKDGVIARYVMKEACISDKRKLPLSSK